MKATMKYARTLLAGMATLTAVALSPAATAQAAYPTKPITLVVPFAPGGFVHTVAMMVAESMGPMLGQNIVVMNRPGANGNVAADFVSRAAPDGYTIFLPTASILTINPHLYKTVTFNPLTDFAPIGQIANTTNMFVVSPNSGIKSMKDLVEAAKANPGKLSYGSSGAGSIQHISGESMQLQAGIKMLHVPYKGIGPAVIDVMGDRLSMVFSDASALPHVKAGRLVALAVSPQRIDDLPGVPTVAEAMANTSIPNFRPPAIWYGLVAPKGTPADVIAKLNEALSKTVQIPEVRSRLVTSGAMPSADPSSAHFGRVIESDFKRYGEMLKALNISVD